MIVYGRFYIYYVESCILSVKCEMLIYLDFEYFFFLRFFYNFIGKWDILIKI